MSVIIRLQNLPCSANASSIRRFFSGLNIPEGGVHIVGGDDGDAFIAFASDDDARKGMLLDKQQINGVPIKLLLSSKSEMQTIIEKARNSAGIFSGAPSTVPSTMYAHNSQSFTQPNYQPTNNIATSPQTQQYSQYSNFNDSYKQSVEPNYYAGSSRDPRNHANTFSGSERSQYGLATTSFSHRSQESGYDQHPNSDFYDRGDHNPYYPTEFDSKRGYCDYQAYPAYRDNHYQSTNSYSHKPASTWPPPDDAYGGKRPHDDYYDAPPTKRNQDIEDGVTEYMIKISTTPEDMHVRDVFDFLKGCKIVPQFGLRFEEDTIGRWTGYIYVMLESSKDFNIALSCNGALYRGRPASVKPVSSKEYFNAYESSFLKKCPRKLHHLLPSKTSNPMSSYFIDGYLELSPLPYDTTEREVVTFVGAPGLTIRDVRLVGYSPKDPKKEGCKAILRLPSSDDIKILMSAKPRSFRPESKTLIQLIPISKLQFEYFLGFPRDIISRRERDRSPPRDDRRSSRIDTVPKDRARTCLQLLELPSSITEKDIIVCIKSVPPSLCEIRFIGSRDGCLIDCQSVSDCTKVYNDLTDSSCPLKKKYSKFEIYKIRKSLFDQLTKSKSNRSNTQKIEDKSRSTNSQKQTQEIIETSSLVNNDAEGDFKSIDIAASTTSHLSNMERESLLLDTGFTGPPDYSDSYKKISVDQPIESRHPLIQQPPPPRWRQPFNGNQMTRPPINPRFNCPNIGMPPLHGQMRPRFASPMTRSRMQHNQNSSQFHDAVDSLYHIHLSNLPGGYTNGKLAADLRPFYPIFSSIRVFPKGQNGSAGQVAFQSMEVAESVMQHFYHTQIEGRTIAARFDLNFHG